MSGKKTAPSPLFGVTSKQSQQAFSSSSRIKRRRPNTVLLSGERGGGGTRRHTPPPLPWAWMEDGKKASLFSSSFFPTMYTAALRSLSRCCFHGGIKMKIGGRGGAKNLLFFRVFAGSLAPRIVRFWKWGKAQKGGGLNNLQVTFYLLLAVEKKYK